MDAFQLENIGLEFPEFVKAAGVSLSLAQNWTNERPLKIWPSVSQAEGSGGRNVYSIYDAYLLAILNMLRLRGISTDQLRVIQLWLTTRFVGGKKVPAAPFYFAKENDWLCIFVSDSTIRIHPVEERAPGVFAPTVDVVPLPPNHKNDKVVMQFNVKISSLRADVNERATRALVKSGKLLNVKLGPKKRER